MTSSGVGLITLVTKESWRLDCCKLTRERATIAFVFDVDRFLISHVLVWEEPTSGPAAVACNSISDLAGTTTVSAMSTSTVVGEGTLLVQGYIRMLMAGCCK